MIIQCINCKKNFELDASLIPKNGRNIQCGSCNHTWFYTHIDTSISPKHRNYNEEKNIEIFDNNEDKNINSNENINTDKGFIISKENFTENTQAINSTKLNKSKSFGLNNILSYILVGIISSVALIIILDTFKSPLSNIFPNLELLLYNLFESIEDMFLFFKNLFN